MGDLVRGVALAEWKSTWSKIYRQCCWLIIATMSIVEGNVDDEDKIKVDNVEDEEYCGAP